MNENRNEPKPTSYQAGEPARTNESIDADEPVESGTASQLDRVIESIKAYEHFGVAAGVALQLLVLFAMILIGAAKGGF